MSVVTMNDQHTHAQFFQKEITAKLTILLPTALVILAVVSFGHVTNAGEVPDESPQVRPAMPWRFSTPCWSPCSRKESTRSASNKPPNATASAPLVFVDCGNTCRAAAFRVAHA
jgi:hypothetical protein